MADYWDRIAEAGKDNIHKRGKIVQKLLSVDLIRKDILEVGVGMGTAAAALMVVYLGAFNYKGTDTSEKNVKQAKDSFNLDVQQANISSLPFPDSSFDVVIALDVLEHVEDKEAGFAEINRVLRPYGKIVINIPLSESKHDVEQEFGFDVDDLYRLLQVCGMDIESYEVYSAEPQPGLFIHYAWAVGVR